MKRYLTVVLSAMFVLLGLFSPALAEDYDFSNEAPDIAVNPNKPGGATAHDMRMPEKARNTIDLYVAAEMERYDKILTAMTDALSQFETTMKFSSSDEATPKVFDSMLEAVFDLATAKLKATYGVPVKWLLEEVLVPGFQPALKLYDTVQREQSRAAKAHSSWKAGEWIRNQRHILSNLKLLKNTGERADELRADLSSDYYELAGGYPNPPTEKQGEFLAKLFEISDKMRNTPALVSADQPLLRFYEDWINAHYTPGGVRGVVVYKFEVKRSRSKTGELGMGYRRKGVSVSAPFGDKIATGLNEIIARRELPWFKRPSDLNAVKLVYLPGIVSGVNREDAQWLRVWPDGKTSTALIENAEMEVLMKASPWKMVQRF